MNSVLDKKDFEDLLEPMQERLVAMSRWLQKSGTRVVVLVEGRDTAGKGGVIRSISEHLNSRHCRSVALPKPDERERSQWYFQRYIAHLPAAGELVLFDRSWYNRAGVEKVMGFATPPQVRSFLKLVPVFERMLVDDGILLLKYWLAVDQAEQEERFVERLHDPLKRSKLSAVDVAARTHYADYTRARETMLRASHSRHAPWTLVDFNDQRLGRLTLIENLLSRIPYQPVRAERLSFSTLPGRPQKERYGVLKPIPALDVADQDGGKD